MTETIRCKRCQGTNIKYVKEWKFKCGSSSVWVEVKLYYCEDCKKSFRITRRIE